GFAAQSFTVGQLLVAGLTDYIYQGFIAFDTSDIPPTATIDSVSFSLYLVDDESDTNFTLALGVADFDGDTGDFIPGDNLPLEVAQFNTSAISSGYQTFSELSNRLKDSINKGGITSYVLFSNRNKTGNAPSGDEYVS